MEFLCSAVEKSDLVIYGNSLDAGNKFGSCQKGALSQHLKWDFFVAKKNADRQFPSRFPRIKA
jgi:hypothetical protein